MQKRVIRYVCHVPALTTRNPFFQTSVLKLNDVYKLQICKLMRNTITGSDVDNNTIYIANLLSIDLHLLPLLTHITKGFQKKRILLL